jgi:hypothetical protein
MTEFAVVTIVTRAPKAGPPANKSTMAAVAAQKIFFISASDLADLVG